MSNKVQQFQLSGAHANAGVLAALRSEFDLEIEPEHTVTITFYDTFDWRLYQAGTQLRRESRGRERQLVWAGLDAERTLGTLNLEGEMPRFAWDFPAGTLREGLEPLLAARALLPLVEVKSRQRVLRMLDDEEKTVLRLVLEAQEGREAGKADPVPLEGRLRVCPVRGYHKPWRRMLRFLEEGLELAPLEGNLLDETLAAVGRRPMDYTSKLNFRFKPGMPAQQAAREIHLHLLDTIETNLNGTRLDLDSEFLHDLRVAVRRTRSALTQIKGVFPEPAVEVFKEGFAWVGQATGPTRDTDVYQLGFGEYRQSLRPEFRQDLDPLHAFLVRHQKSEHREMVKKLNSPHFRKLLKDWRSFLENPPQGGAPNASRPVCEVAGERIWKMYRRVMKEGEAITEVSPPEDLHELRKSCKKLRYLIEFFRSIYPSKEVAQAIKEIKVLLDNLGNHQDLEVQAHKLREFAHQMVAEGQVPPDTLLAMGMLVDGLLERQRLARAEFQARFAAFAAASNTKLFTGLFGRPGGERKGKKR
ncbi:MAG TPA: CHAD domain-containing protein [Sedimenticola sp.]|nr:CHAD domain-containing protein [Sedimenticola sp.]